MHKIVIISAVPQSDSVLYAHPSILSDSFPTQIYLRILRSVLCAIQLFLIIYFFSNEFLLYFRYYQIYDLHIVYFSQSVDFHFIYGFLCSAKGFQFDVVPLVYICFCCLCFWLQIKKSPPRTMPRSLSPLFSSFHGFRSYFQVFHSFCIDYCACYTTVTQFQSLACGCPVFPTPFIEETALSLFYILSPSVAN